MKRNLILCACITIVLVSAVILTACAGQQESLSAQSESSSGSVSSATAGSSAPAQASSAASAPAIGAGDVTVEVGNATGYDITGIRIKPVSQDAYSPENSFEGFVFGDKSTAALSFTGAAQGGNYDVLLLTSVDSKIAVRDIDLAHLKNISFRFEQGVGFITYTDAASGEGADNRDQAFAAEGIAASSARTYDTENQAG